MCSVTVVIILSASSSSPAKRLFRLSVAPDDPPSFLNPENYTELLSTRAEEILRFLNAATAKLAGRQAAHSFRTCVPHLLRFRIGCRCVVQINHGFILPER